MMNEKVLELKRKLYSNIEWLEETEGYLTDHFISLGFRCPEDFMGVRVYDFLNFDHTGRNFNEEIVECLSEFLYPERKTWSEPTGWGTTEAVVKWLAEYPDLNEVFLRDLICDEELSLEDMMYLFDHISMSFYHSSEYNSRKYRYGHISEIEYPFCGYGC